MPLIRRPGPPLEPPATPSVVLLERGSADERWAAARALAARPEGTAALIAALAREREPRVLEAILSGLARLESPDAIDALVGGVRSDDAALRTGAMGALRTAPAALRDRLPGLLEDPSADVRLLACDLARALAPDAAAPLLCARLAQEGEVNVCAAAVETLAEIGDETAAGPLQACADRFPGEPFLRFAIAEACRRLSARPAGARG